MLGASFVIWLLFKTASPVAVTIFSMINDDEMLFSQFIHLSFIHLSFNGKLTSKGRTSMNHWVGLLWDSVGPAIHAPKSKCRTVYCFYTSLSLSLSIENACEYPSFVLKQSGLNETPLEGKVQISTSSWVWHSFYLQIRNQIFLTENCVPYRIPYTTETVNSLENPIE